MTNEISSSALTWFAVPNGFTIEVNGADATKIVNNLVTNDVARLEEHDCLEAFVTNVRGWVMAHVHILKLPNQIVLAGAHPKPSEICEHLDRYIIREDAEVVDRSAELPPHLIVNGQSLGDVVASSRADKLGSNQIYRVSGSMIGADELLLCSRDTLTGVLAGVDREFTQGTPSDFELWTVKSMWPTHTREILEKTLPQELDREQAISFTKGCYLGQETIARLDAIGQLQKKLSLLAFEGGGELPVGASIMSGEREVGKLTSAASEGGTCYGLAHIKRGFYDLGTELKCQGQTGTVIAPISPS